MGFKRSTFCPVYMRRLIFQLWGWSSGLLILITTIRYKRWQHHFWWWKVEIFYPNGNSIFFLHKLRLQSRNQQSQSLMTAMLHLELQYFPGIKSVKLLPKEPITPPPSQFCVISGWPRASAGQFLWVPGADQPQVRLWPRPLGRGPPRLRPQLLRCGQQGTEGEERTDWWLVTFFLVQNGVTMGLARVGGMCTVQHNCVIGASISD